MTEGMLGDGGGSDPVNELKIDPAVGQPVSPDGPSQPRLIIFDVNETLSDMRALQDRFAEVGAAPASESLR